jgi:hypothetical protein
MNNHYRELSPDLETVAIELVIGGLMTRRGLDLVKRELVAIASLVGATSPRGSRRTPRAPYAWPRPGNPPLPQTDGQHGAHAVRPGL